MSGRFPISPRPLRLDPLDARAFAGRGQAWENKGEQREGQGRLPGGHGRARHQAGRQESPRHRPRPSGGSWKASILNASPRRGLRASGSVRRRGGSDARAAPPSANCPSCPTNAPGAPKIWSRSSTNFSRWVDHINLDEYAQLRTSSSDPCKIDRVRLQKLQTDIQAAELRARQQPGRVLSVLHQQRDDEDRRRDQKEGTSCRQAESYDHVYRTSILHGRLEKLEQHAGHGQQKIRIDHQDIVTHEEIFPTGRGTSCGIARSDLNERRTPNDKNTCKRDASAAFFMAVPLPSPDLTPAQAEDASASGAPCDDFSKAAASATTPPRLSRSPTSRPSSRSRPKPARRVWSAPSI